MRIYRISETWQDKRTLYSDKTGYIKGFRDDDERWHIMEFVIFPEYRGKGLARELAKHIPWKSVLYVSPLVQHGETSPKQILNSGQLMDFYQSLGFESTEEDVHVMVRG